MTTMTVRPARDGSLIVGGLLVAVGLLALALSYTGLDPSDWLGGSGWTLFVITPGVLMLFAGLASARQPGEGLAIAGAIVTTVGLLLLVMDRTSTWEAWAYAWALIPAGAGVGVLLHGLRAADRGRMLSGVRLVAISSGLFLLGAWYFRTLFETGVAPIELGVAWPVLLIGAGAVVIAVGLLGRGRSSDPRAS